MSISRKMSRAALNISAALFLSVSAAYGAELFEPRATYGVIAGVLSWKDPSLASYSVKNRKDRELYDALLARGAASGNFSLILDSEATKTAVYAAVGEIAARAPAGSTFIFYYAGHGLKEGKGVFFANYDIDLKDAEVSGISVRELGALIARNFKGAKVILLADCCYSGALQEEAQKLNSGGIKALALTSASASNISAGSWTFSQTIIDGLAGRSLLDRDDDGFITAEELSRDVSEAMKYRELQLSGSFIPPALQDAAVSAVKGDPAVRAGLGVFSVGEYVAVPGEGAKKTAQILELSGGDSLLEFYDYSDKLVSTAPVGGLSGIEFKIYPAGAKVAVMWGGEPWAAEVLEVRDCFHLISYPGWPHSWDEWVASDRIVDVPEKDRRRTPAPDAARLSINAAAGLNPENSK